MPGLPGRDHLRRGVARWAARPIATFQPTSPLVPLVLGPRDIPRLSVERALHEPWLAVLSALVHIDERALQTERRSVVAALRQLPEAQAEVCYNLLRASLSAQARRELEEEMEPNRFERYGAFFEKTWYEGKAAGLHEAVLALAERFGALSPALRERVTACEDRPRLVALTVELAGAADREAVEARLLRLPPAREP